MHDDELRDKFAAWARPLTATAPPPVPAIRRRARLRTARIAVSCIAALAVLGGGAFSASRVLGTGHPGGPAPAASPTPTGHPAGGNGLGPNPRYAEAPYYIAVTQRQQGTAWVWNAVTAKRIAALQAPAEGARGHRYRTFFTDIAAAGDDRTFVLAAIPYANPSRALPVWLFKVRLSKHGEPGPLIALLYPHERQGVSGHWNQGIVSIALSPDGSKLAIATDRNYGDSNGPPDIEVITLASGATRTWTASPQDIGSLSWAGNRTIAYACDGVCLLDTTAPGHRLTKANVLIPWSTRYRGMQGLQWPVITPDGAHIYVAMEGGGTGLVEFSARTGKPLRLILGPRPTDSEPCAPLWSDATGAHLIVTCAWGQVTGTVAGGKFRWGHDLAPGNVADNASGFGGYVIGW